MRAIDESIRRIFTRRVRFGIPIALLAIGGCVGQIQSSPEEEWPWPLMPGDRLLHLKSPLTPELAEIATTYINGDSTLKEDTQLGMDVFDRPFNLWTDMSGVFADIADDGESEAFLRFTNGPFCGSVGCSIAILRKSGGQWRPICESMADTDYIVILEHKDHGMHQVLLSAAGATCYDIMTWPYCGAAPENPQYRVSTEAEIVGCE